MRAASIPSTAPIVANSTTTSLTKSSATAEVNEPVDPPTPRSSQRRTAIPRRASASARTKNGRCPMMASSRSWGPLPETSNTAGAGCCFDAPSGRNSVPSRKWPSGCFTRCETTVYGNGGLGSCTRALAPGAGSGVPAGCGTNTIGPLNDA